MKKIIISVVLLSIASASFCQQTTTEPIQIAKTDYLKKSRNQKTAAWLLLAGGIVTTGIGIVVASVGAANDLVNSAVDLFSTGSSSSKSSGGEGIIIAGLFLQAASIPLFITSANNKRRAMLEVKDLKTAIGLPIPTSKNITGLTLSIPIGK